MKRLTLFFLAVIGFSQLYAQDITDAVRYSSENLAGTARFTGMSGAFGALGGDFSAIGINPAGSAVFLNSAATVSLNIDYNQNDVNFMNGFSNSSDSDFNLNQAGAVFLFNNTSEDSPFKKFSVALTYDQVNNFENEIFAFGNNSQSIDTYFLNKANGVPLDLFIPLQHESLSDLYTYLGSANFSAEGFNNYDLQEAYLGYETYLFDAVDPDDLNNTAYTSNVVGSDFYQEYNQISTGLNGKFSINAATQFKNDLYMGININSHFINYERTTAFYEENNNEESEINRIYYENTLRTFGSGLSFQVGAIYKLGKMVRLGASYTSPTWYTLSEETVQYLETASDEFGTAIADPRVTNLFPDYQLRTPGKITASMAVVFGKSGLISFDWSNKNFANTEFGSEYGDHVFAVQNSVIENNLKTASTYRIGGEYRLSEWSLRAGYRLEESPYRNEKIMGNLTGYSFGVGYDFGNIELDFAFDRASRDYGQRLYQTGFTERAMIDNTNSHYTLSLSFGI
ncbi:MAG TPA: outer membrane protein transport protein [Flavobacteriaceae bacterium]|nr:outer membrane protein transport protein [Flavobacteriaceae bacterium]